jgi:hypothetical protein
MTSETREYSAESGAPITFFRFTRVNVHWYYTDADRAIVYGGNTYTPAAISHSEITDGGDSGKISITITMPKDLPVAGNWSPWPPQDTIVCTIMTQHAGETDVLVDWIGRVVQPRISDSTLTLTSEPTATTAKRGGKGRKLQRQCDLVHYGPLCGVDPAGHELPATLSAVSGFDLTATAFLSLPTGRLAGGYIEWVRPDGLTDRRSIDAHTGSTITVDYGAEDFEIGLAVSAYPGCAHTDEDCDGYFDNLLNNGGFKWIPKRNQFDGNPNR